MLVVVVVLVLAVVEEVEDAVWAMRHLLRDLKIDSTV